MLRVFDPSTQDHEMILSSLKTAKDYGKMSLEIGLIEGGAATLKKVLSITKRRRPELEPTPVRVKGFAHPLYLRISTSDWEVFRQVFIEKGYQEPYMARPHAAQLKRFYNAVLDSGKTPVIVDCGANIGLSAVWYSSQFPKAVVVAIEPEPRNFAMLQKNTLHHDHVIAVNAAISSRKTRVSP
jgi:hypothetical protein